MYEKLYYKKYICTKLTSVIFIWNILIMFIYLIFTYTLVIPSSSALLQ